MSLVLRYDLRSKAPTQSSPDDGSPRRDCLRTINKTSGLRKWQVLTREERREILLHYLTNRCGQLLCELERLGRAMGLPLVSADRQGIPLPDPRLIREFADRRQLLKVPGSSKQM